jgi:hypothetical protein
VTLVLFIPFVSGALLISDRQSTKTDDTKEVWDKIYLIEKSNAIIGFSGSSEGSRSIAQDIILSQSGKTFIEQYTNSYRKYYHITTIDSKEKDIVSLCIVKTSDSIQSYKFTGEIFNILQKPTGIGAGEHIIRPQLILNTSIVSFETALEFGKALIEYASMVSTEVGSPSQLGFCLGVVQFDGKIINQVLDPEQVSIDKMLYRFV